jgi:hypothetical protein
LAKSLILTFSKNYNLMLIKKFSCILLFQLFIYKSYAQPGWRDYSRSISYTIKDVKDSIIQFKNNEGYSIIVKNKLYANNTIPTDDFIPAINNGHTFSYQITINDCKIQIPFSDNLNKNNNLEISIVHKKDTMHILGISFLQLKFEKGFFYFPTWANVLLGNESNFKISGVVSLKHYKNQNVFKVPSNIFYHKSNFEYDRYKTDNVATHFINKKYVDNNIRYTRKIENIKWLNPLPYFTKISISNGFYPTNNPNIFYGKQEYNYDEGNTYYSRAFFTIFDKEKLTLKNWQVNSNIFSYYTGKFWLDSFTNKLHIIVGCRDTAYDRNKYADDSNYPIKNNYYSSSNYGNDWVLDKSMYIISTYNFNELEILDNNFYLGYKIDEQEVHRKLVGRYYLLKDFKIVDSLITPDGIYYNSIYNNYRFYKINNNLVNLGPWGFSENDYYKPFYKPQIIKENNKWEFNVEKDSVGSNSRYQTYLKTLYKDKKQYQNFSLNGDGVIAFKNTKGTIAVPNYERIIENGENMFIFLNYGVLVSFNAGKDWTFLPINTKEYEDRAEVVEIDKANNISFYKLSTLKKHVVKFESIKK